MDETPLTQRLREGLLDRGDQARGTVADHQQRGGQGAALQAGEEVMPCVGRLPGAGSQADERGLAIGGDAQAAPRPVPVLVLDLLTDGRTADLEIATWSPGASARAASTSRTGRPRRKEAITSVSSAFALATCDPNSRDANASVAPRSFGRDSCTGPAVVLTVTSRYPFEDLRQRLARSKQLVDVAADALGRGILGVAWA
jgi:hypothetical protein